MPSRDLKDLYPELAIKAESLVDDAYFKGLDLLVYCTHRSFSEQARLYRNGRSLDSIIEKSDELANRYERPDLAKILLEAGPQYGEKILTHAAPGESYHNYGMAFDAVPLREGRTVGS